MTGREAKCLFNNAVLYLEKNFPDIKFSFDANVFKQHDLDFGEGILFENDDSFVPEKYICSVNAKRFDDSPDVEFSDYDVMRPFVGLFHEVYGHYLQTVAHAMLLTGITMIEHQDLVRNCLNCVRKLVSMT